MPLGYGFIILKIFYANNTGIVMFYHIVNVICASILLKILLN
jgi:hypothetical protein